jgi:hypothetical protein
MAKRKTPKVKDLRPETISKEQLQRLQKAVQSIQMAQADIGALELRKHEALHAVLQMQMLVDELREEFKKEYGTDNISLTDGKIKYNDTDEADKNDNDR